jgi:hypothetical protein
MALWCGLILNEVVRAFLRRGQGALFTFSFFKSQWVYKALLLVVCRSIDHKCAKPFKNVIYFLLYALLL